MAASWITWAPRGRDQYTNPRSTRAHFGEEGGPLACGRWAPSEWDAYFRRDDYAKRCQRCVKALERSIRPTV